jgi:LytS/YehU family sensor histidine kinase
MTTNPPSRSSHNPQIVNTRYIYVVYSLFIYATGMLSRISINHNVRVAVIQTVMFETIFLLIMLLSAFLAERLPLRVSVSTIVVAFVEAVAVGVVYTKVLIAYALIPMLMSIVPSTDVRIYPSQSVALYYTMFAVIWNLTVLWFVALRRAVNNEIVAIEARNTSEKHAILSELRLLRQQLDPHFIFNCLNMIITEVHDSPPDAAASMRELSTYLRYTFDTGEREFVTVSDEVTASRSLLNIYARRLGPRLETTIDVEPDATPFLVPTLLIQPVIENALKYGVPDAAGKRRVLIAIRSDDDLLTIVVTNSGRYAPTGKGENSANVGLANLRSRIQLHYGERGSFDIRQVGDDVVATICLRGEPQ